MLSIRGNDYQFQKHFSKYAEHTQNEFHRWLSIRGTHFIAGWAYEEMISSLTEHARKCLKVEYLGGFEYDFFKSCVCTGLWDNKVSVSAKKSKKKFHACVPLSRYNVKHSKMRIYIRCAFGSSPLYHCATHTVHVNCKNFQHTYTSFLSNFTA